MSVVSIRRYLLNIDILLQTPRLELNQTNSKDSEQKKNTQTLVPINNFCFHFIFKSISTFVPFYFENCFAFNKKKEREEIQLKEYTKILLE